PARALEHEAKIALHSGARESRFTRTEMARSRIRRARVATDEMRFPGERLLEGFLEKARAAYAGRREDPDLVHLEGALDVGAVDDAVVLSSLSIEKLYEFLRGARDNGHAIGGEPSLQLGKIQYARDFLLEPSDYLAWRA